MLYHYLLGEKNEKFFRLLSFNTLSVVQSGKWSQFNQRVVACSNTATKPSGFFWKSQPRKPSKTINLIQRLERALRIWKCHWMSGIAQQLPWDIKIICINRLPSHTYFQIRSLQGTKARQKEDFKSEGWQTLSITYPIATTFLLPWQEKLGFLR